MKPFEKKLICLNYYRNYLYLICFDIIGLQLKEEKMS